MSVTLGDGQVGDVRKVDPVDPLRIDMPLDAREVALLDALVVRIVGDEVNRNPAFLRYPRTVATVADAALGVGVAVLLRRRAVYGGRC